MRSASIKPCVASAFIGLALCAIAPSLGAGSFSAALNDPANSHDAPVPGFTGPHGPGRSRLATGMVDENGQPVYENPGNHVNPLFFAWAETITDYLPSEFVSPQFSDPSLALGPVTGDNFDVVSLGDLSAPAIAADSPAGSVTLELARPVLDLTGADFVIFENGHIAQSDFGGAGIGGIFGELASIEVSANGVDFVPFPSTSLTAGPVNGYGSIDPTQVRNLAGKHVNAFGDSWGTPFDLTEVGLAQITHIRIVDIPGDGSIEDSSGNPTYDPWKTFGSGGFDLEAVGAVSTTMTFAEWPQLANLAPEYRAPNSDPDGDGISNLLEYAFATLPWKPDSAAPQPALTNNHAEITFIRDERLTDLIYEVQASSTMAPQDWITLASSSAGAPVQGANGHNPVVSETSAESIQSIGVIRRTSVRDIAPIAPGSRRFLRVKVTTTSASIPAE